MVQPTGHGYLLDSYCSTLYCCRCMYMIVAIASDIDIYGVQMAGFGLCSCHCQRRMEKEEKKILVACDPLCGFRSFAPFVRVDAKLRPALDSLSSDGNETICMYRDNMSGVLTLEHYVHCNIPYLYLCPKAFLFCTVRTMQRISPAGTACMYLQR